MAVWDARPSYPSPARAQVSMTSASMIGVVWETVIFLDPIMIGLLYGDSKIGI